MNKLNLFLILISSIIFSLLTRVVEGACNYNFDENTSQGKEQKKLFCNNSQIGATQLRQKNFLTKIGNLVSLATKTQKQVFLNQKNIGQNAKNNKALAVVADPDGEEDTSDACKQYPEAC
tara:strand:- start:5 stop:364 length:360 start_codon:yes stop_codon:yes gene_type:complete